MASWQARLRTHHHRSGQHATGTAEDHDERGQPGTCLRLRPAAERRHRPGPPGNDHRQPHRHPPERAAGVRPPGRGDQEEDRREDRRLR
ncbi:hypothetical protein G6F32_016035 [Rhizopus arrhizus]|nr:hypothetical protein G6F32_016035 [Rhizopus arrhizus]